MKNYNSKAEIKDRKFGETSARNGGGNPEPSPGEREGVETRHGPCLKCGGQIPAHKYKNAKYCSDRCRGAYIAYLHAIRTGRIKNPGVGSGGAQWGENNHMYRTGIGTFRKRALKHYGNICNRCMSTKKLEVHHIDEDRTNNQIENLEVLCKKCHKDHHIIRDELGRFAKTNMKG